MIQRIRTAGLICALLMLTTLLLVACTNTPNDPTPEGTPEVTPEMTLTPTEPIATEKETEPMTEPVTTEEITTEEITTEEVTTERTPDGTIPFVPDHPETIDTDW